MYLNAITVTKYFSSFTYNTQIRLFRILPTVAADGTERLVKCDFLFVLYSDLRSGWFNGPLSGTTRVSRYLKSKTNLDFTEARDSEWQWHQLGHMQVCTSRETDNHASTHHSVFYRPGALPAAQPTASKHRRQEFHLQDDGKNQLAYTWNEIMSLSPYV